MNRKRHKEMFEAIGLSAIVVSVVFLALETRQNTNAVYAESRQSILTAAQSELFQIVENPELVVSVTKEDLLTEEEQVALSAWLTAAMRAREFSWLQHRDGTIDEAQWNTEVLVIRWILDSDRTRNWWVNVGRKNVNPSFADFVDGNMQSHPGTGDSWRAETNWAQH
jgi:hypothetical protein